MNNYICDVIQELRSTQSGSTGCLYTIDQCLKIVEIANLKKLTERLELIDLKLRTMSDISDSLETIAEDQRDLKEAIVREKTNRFGDSTKYACVTTYHD